MNTAVVKKVLVVDDSAVVRRRLTNIINQHPRLCVVGIAADTFIARKQIKQHSPDVLTLDVELPRMDGHQFLKNLMRLRPMPVVMISSLTGRDTVATKRALELGAVDVVCKPSNSRSERMQDYSTEVCNKLLAAASTPVTCLHSCSPVDTGHVKAARLIALGASTGGTQALDEVIRSMAPGSAGVVIVQHIPASFSGAFAKKLDQHSALHVSEAVDGDYILQGHAYVAPGGRHLRVIKEGAHYRCRLSDHDPVCGHRPSVDVLFSSLARYAPHNSIGIILTGMGSDGAQGLLQMHNSGARTIAQDQESSVIWGMPGSAVSLGAADKVLPLCDIADYLGHKNAWLSLC